MNPREKLSKKKDIEEFFPLVLLIYGIMFYFDFVHFKIEAKKGHFDTEKPHQSLNFWHFKNRASQAEAEENFSPASEAQFLSSSKLKD